MKIMKTILIFCILGLIDSTSGLEETIGLEYDEPTECVEIERRENVTDWQQLLGCRLSEPDDNYKKLLDTYEDEKCEASKENYLENCNPADYEKWLKYGCILRHITQDCAEGKHKDYQMEDIDTPVLSESEFAASQKSASNSETCFATLTKLQDIGKADIETSCPQALKCFGRDNIDVQYKEQIDKAKALSNKYEDIMNKCQKNGHHK